MTIHKLALRVLLVGMIFALPACGGLKTEDLWQNPKVNLSDVRVTQMTFDGLSLDADLDVTNPNKFDLPYSAIEYTLNVEERDLFSGLYDQSGSVEAGGTQKMTLPLSFKYEDILNLAQNANLKDGVDYNVKGRVLFNIPVVGQVGIPLQKTGTLPALQIPVVNVEGIDLKSMGLTGADLILRLKVENPNSFDLALGGFSYNLSLNGNKAISGSNLATTAWNPGESKTLSIPVKVPFVAGGNALASILGGKGDLDYQISFDSSISSSIWPILKNLPLKTTQKGTLKLGTN